MRWMTGCCSKSYTYWAAVGGQESPHCWADWAIACVTCT